MKKSLILLTVLILLTPSLVFSDLVTVKGVYFVPRLRSDVREINLWWTEFDQMNFKKTHYQTTSLGFSYEYFLAREISLVLSIDSYNKNKAGTYEGYVSEEIDGLEYAFDYGEGYPITHVFNVSITPIQVSLKLTPLGRRGKFIPYIGGGVGLYLWNIRLQGAMIDFSEYEEFYDPVIDADVIGFPVYGTDAWEDNKFSVGYHAFGGIMVPFARRVSFEVEFKYNLVEGNLTKAFEGFEFFDLSMYQISLGLNYWF